MNSGPIQLNFPKRTRFAGELLLGSVDINVKEAQQDEIDHVRVRIRGSLQTKIKRSNGKTTTTYRSNVPLIRIDIPLWQRGKAFPPPGTHILTVPFKYRLPADLPPSFHAKSSRKQGVVTYFLEVVATRPGMFQSNRRVRAMIAVVPAGIPEHVTLRNDLAGGWSPHMPWKTYVSDAAIRTGIWADYSHVKVVFRVPDIPAFPIGTPIPVQLDIVTKTRPLKPSEIPADGAPGEPLFPAPPTVPGPITLRLDRLTRIAASGIFSTVSDSMKDHVADLGGFGSRAPSIRPSPRENLRSWQDDPTWTTVTEEKRSGFLGMSKETVEKRICRRASHFATNMVFTCPPAFQTKMLGTSYKLHLCVPFPGIGNDVKRDIAINIVSGSLPPSHNTGGASTSGQQPSAPVISTPAPSDPPVPAVVHDLDVETQQPPPPFSEAVLTMDLPPAYWSAEDHDFDADEKT